MTKWDKRYDTDQYVYGTEPNEFLRQFVLEQVLRGKRILAIAEGEGRNAVWLASLGNDVEMWDASRIGLEKAKRLAEQRDVTVKTKLVDLSEADWPNETYDVIVCIFGHFPSDIKSHVFEGIKTSLRPNGLFISEVYAEQQLAYGTGGPKDKEFLYSLETFEQLEDELTPVVLRQVVVERREGELHRGQSAVIQYAGQKR